MRSCGGGIQEKKSNGSAITPKSKSGSIDLLDWLEISLSCVPVPVVIYACILLFTVIGFCMLNIHLVGGAIFPRVYYLGMPNSLISWGCQIPCGDAKIPREFYSGMPNSLGCHIPCDTGASTKSSALTPLISAAHSHGQWQGGLVAVSSLELWWYARGCRDTLVGDVISEGRFFTLSTLIMATILRMVVEVKSTS